MADSGVTARLAGYALSDGARLPAPILAQAARAFVNHVGCTVGAAREPACVLALAQADLFSGARCATAFGQQVRLDAPHAALVNGLQSSIQTFDDTHLASVVHPTGPIAAAAFALLEHEPARAVSGTEFLATLCLGIEIACRVGAALTAPGSGLHLGVFTTGLAGAIGAAAACGRLLRLDTQRVAWAIGIAAVQTGGLRVSHASMSGGLLAGLAARTGLSAALLAASGFDCGADPLEGRNGLLDVFAPGARAADMAADLHERFEMAELAYKPYPCGIVIHPAIDACLALAPLLRGESIERVELRVNPLALQLTGTRHPRHSMDCKVSLFHWAAGALLRERAGLAEQTEDAVADPAIAALRDRIHAEAQADLARDEARVSIHLASGRVLEHHIAHARGSRSRPMTDEELDAKFAQLAAPVLGDAAAANLLAACRSLPGLGPEGLLRVAELARIDGRTP
ncbi:MAG: MmgE/PrpD family protein [Variovorax sp.]|nr:MmgE/PrpD family protein [Variovorax sp.]